MKVYGSGCLLFLCLLALTAVSGCDIPGDGESGDAATTKTVVQAPSQPPTYTPEVFHGEYMFVIDASADAGTVDPTTGMSRLEMAAADTVAKVNALTSDDSFEVMSYGGWTVTDFCFGMLVKATPYSVSRAISYLRSLVPTGPSPQYSALKIAIGAAPVTLTKMYFYSASLPGADPGAPHGTATPANILSDFPSWWAQTTNTELVAARVGNVAYPHADYMQQLAALAGGSYLELP